MPRPREAVKFGLLGGTPSLSSTLTLYWRNWDKIWGRTRELTIWCFWRHSTTWQNLSPSCLVRLQNIAITCCTYRSPTDYEPPTDLERFPRKDIHFLKPEDNKLGAWAWKFTVKDIRPNGGILSGKTVVMKDNISVAGVNCLLGTDAMTGFVRFPLIIYFIVSSVLTPRTSYRYPPQTPLWWREPWNQAVPF